MDIEHDPSDPVAALLDLAEFSGGTGHEPGLARLAAGPERLRGDDQQALFREAGCIWSHIIAGMKPQGLILHIAQGPAGAVAFEQVRRAGPRRSDIVPQMPEPGRIPDHLRCPAVAQVRDVHPDQRGDRVGQLATREADPRVKTRGPIVGIEGQAARRVPQPGFQRRSGNGPEPLPRPAREKSALFPKHAGVISQPPAHFLACGKEHPRPVQRGLAVRLAGHPAGPLVEINDIPPVRRPARNLAIDPERLGLCGGR